MRIDYFVVVDNVLWKRNIVLRYSLKTVKPFGRHIDRERKREREILTNNIIVILFNNTL